MFTKKRSRLLAILIAFAMTISMIPFAALAEDGEPADSEPTAVEKLESAKDTAVKAADAAEKAAEAAETALSETTGSLTETKTAETAAETALGEADAAIKGDTDAITEDIEAITDYTEADEKTDEKYTTATDAIADAEAKIGGLVEEVNAAVEAANEVVAEATEVIESVKPVAEKADAAVDAANKALKAAEDAENAYHQLLQEAVTENSSEAYNKLAEAEIAMNEKWNEYTAQQETADGLMNDYFAVIAEAEATVKQALNAADAAQKEADRLLNVWREAEAAMLEALNGTNDEELKKLEGYRRDARDAALAASANARDARAKAAEAYNMALEAGAIANEVVGKANGLSKLVSDMTGSLSAAVEAAQADAFKGSEATEGKPGEFKYEKVSDKIEHMPSTTNLGQPEFVFIKDAGPTSSLYIWSPAGLTQAEKDAIIAGLENKKGLNLANEGWYGRERIVFISGEDIADNFNNGNTISIEKGTDGSYSIRKSDGKTISNVVYGGIREGGTPGTPAREAHDFSTETFSVPTTTGVTVPDFELENEFEAFGPPVPEIKVPEIKDPGGETEEPGEKEPGEETEEPGEKEPGGEETEIPETPTPTNPPRESNRDRTPNTPEVNINDEDVPLNEYTPEVPEEVVVVDEETPLAAFPPATEEELIIVDEDVPLGALPQTSSSNTAGIMAAILGILGFLGLGWQVRGKRSDEI